MDNIIIKDTMEIFIQSLIDPTEVYFLGINLKSNWVKKLSNTIGHGGLNNLPKYLLQTANEMTLSVEPLFWDDSFISLSSGDTNTNGTATIKVNEKLEVISGIINLNGNPSGINCDIFDANNRHYVGTIADKTVTILNPPPDNTLVTIIYDSVVTGSITNLNASNFPKAYRIFGHTIGFSPKTQQVVNDLYINYFKAIPDGNLNMALEAGKNSTIPINFQIITPINSNSFGQYISVLRTYSIKIDQPSFQGSIGHIENLTATVRLNNEIVTDKNVIWSSSDENVGIIFKNAVWENTLTIDNTTLLDNTTNYDNTLDASIFLSSILGNSVGYLNTAKLISKGVVVFKATIENEPQISDGILGIVV